METGRLEELRSVLRGRGFRRLIGSQVISQAADGLYQIALASVLILNVSAARTPGQVTKILAVTLLPFSLVGPFTGPFIDRFSRRSILIGTSVTRAGLTLLLVPALGWAEPLLLALVVANVSINRFFHSTKSAVLPSLVPADRVLLANTVSSTGGMVFGLLGAVVGGPLADALSEEAVIVAAAACMGVAAAVAAALRLPRGEKRGLAGIASELRENWRDVAHGLHVLRSSPRAVYAVSAIWWVRGLLGFVLLAAIVIVRARFGFGATGVSGLLAAIAVGGFLGAVLVPEAARRLGDPRVPPAAFLLTGVATLALGTLPFLASTLALVFVGGLSMSATKIASDTIVQRAIPDAFRGRAFSIYDLGYNGVFVLAALIPTFLSPWVGPTGLILTTGALYLAGGLALRAWAGRLPGAIEVRCYAGSRGDEVPREVVWDGQAIPVAAVERSWREDRAGERLLCFRLRLEDGTRIQVSRGTTWHLDRRLSGGRR